jgi:aldehyde dehydrogenase (NAD+)
MSESKSISETYADLRKTVKSRKTHSMEWREAQLRALSKMLDEHHDDFIAALNTDLKRSEFLSELSELAQLKASVRDTISMLDDYAKPTGRISMLSMPMKFFPATGARVPEPLGLVLIIAPWNYPVLLALHPAVGAIAAGNAVLLKPSEISSATSNLLAKLIPQYLDQETIRVIEGGVEETTEILNHKFDHIFYTGSTTVGRIIYQAAAKHLTPVTLELGGKSPVLVDMTANLKLAARRILFAKFINCGQICIAPDYCIVTKDNASAFYEALKETYNEMFPDSLKTNEEYCRIINDGQTKRLVSFLDEVSDEELSKRGQVLVGGESDVETRYVGITIFQNTQLDSKIMQDEIFGPLLPIVEVDTMDEAIDIVNDREKPLALYLFTSNQLLIEKVTQQTSSGAISINECIMHFAVEDLPFGGVGESGIGCYHGKATFETFSHLKTVFHQSGSNIMDVPFRYPPYTDKKKYLMRKFF